MDRLKFKDLKPGHVVKVDTVMSNGDVRDMVIQITKADIRGKDIDFAYTVIAGQDVPNRPEQYWTMTKTEYLDQLQWKLLGDNPSVGKVLYGK